MEAEALTGGFADTSRDSAIAFRAAMEAMGRPGTIQPIAGATPPAPLSGAAGALVLTLCDPETPLHLAGMVDTPAIRDWVAFHAGSPLVPAGEAMFAVGHWADLLPIERFRAGTPEYPDRSATLIVEMSALSTEGAVLSGPGIRDTARLCLPDIPVLQRNHARFPLGVDLFLTAGDRLAALPRSTEIR